MRDESAPCHQVVRNVDHEERIAVAAAVDRGGEAPHRGRAPVGGGKPPYQVFLHRGLGERAQGELPAEPVELQLFLDRGQWMLTGLHGSIRAEHDEPRPLRAPAEEGQPVERRHVAPVQVLEPQDHRRLRGERVHGLGQLAEHPLARGGLRPRWSTLSSPGPTRDGIWTIQVGAYCARAGTAASRSGSRQSRVERIEDWQVGFSRAVVVDALAAADADGGGGGDLAEERLHHRRLADPRLAGDEDDLPLALPRRGQPPVELLELPGSRPTGGSVVRRSSPNGGG